MERAQISLLAQGVDGSRTRLLQRFRSAERALLLGTASFWEGVDIPGEALSALIIGRLPFAVPVDPVFAARSEQFEAPFLEYALPQAVLRFKQGFGRLIRTKNDRGVVLVLDGRIVSKLYGSSFVNSLPTCTVKRAPVGTAAALAREWLAGDPIPILERGGSA
jgi:DNA polymerase-3 subunit epsilon/ATP-dependent DNA helicase DinG